LTVDPIPTKLRAPIAADQPALERLAVESGLFQPSEMGAFSDMMRAYFAGETEGDFWIVGDQDGAVLSAGYCGPEAFADRVFNLFFIAVEPRLQGSGHGSALLQAVEEKARDAGARILIIETSGLGSFALTRRFYRQHSYDEEARIRDYYGPGDDKVVFWKKLQE